MSKVVTRKSSSDSIKGTLVLHIKPGDALLIGSDISILIDSVVTKNKVKVVITAPKSTRVRRRGFERRNQIQDKTPSEA